MLVGATGLVGRFVLPLLLDRAERESFRVHAPTRRTLDLQHSHLSPIQGDLSTEQGLALVDQVLADDGVRLESFVCALGTTMKQAGSDAAFAAVDRDLVLKLALIAHRHGARQAVVVSSVGADAASPSFYLRVKGEMETGILALGFERADFLQPGLLLGPRDQQRRHGERIAQMLSPLYNPLLMGPLRRFRAIRAETVAAAMATLVGRQGTGVMMLTNPSIEEMARGR
jgi:uncharacterized protein YbjT (DUF2867 family)